ncbi:MAG: hypothetical protein NUV45_01805 [Tepidanaerobacteraceae bacterium]|nr:hypothetical protein [Tepidanaerobacteraceae bacterium]
MKNLTFHDMNPPINAEIKPGQYMPSLRTNLFLETKKYSAIITPATGVTQEASMDTKPRKWLTMPDMANAVPMRAEKSVR